MNLKKLLTYRPLNPKVTPRTSAYKFYWSIGKCSLDVHSLEYTLDSNPLLGQNSTFFKLDSGTGITFTDYFVCDPFLINFDSKLLIFFEICGYIGDKYVTAIAKVETNQELNSVENFSVVKFADDKKGENRTHTISYPYPIILHGELFLVLEEYSQQLDTRVYKYDLRSNNLEAVGSLPGRIYDPNIHEVNGRIWIYGIDRNYLIRVFVGESISGPFYEHTSSRKYQGKTFARNAGAVFILNGSMIRPFQDCSESYGSSLGFSEIKIDDDLGFQILKNLSWDNLRITGHKANPYWATSKAHHFTTLNISSNSITGLIDAARKFHITNHGWMQY